MEQGGAIRLAPNPRQTKSSIQSIALIGRGRCTANSEWQLALALLSGMDVGSSEWQLALALLSGMDVDSIEWQLALALLSGMAVTASGGT